MNDRILAHHAHVFPESVRPNGSIGRLLQLMDTCEIAEAVCFAPFSYQLAETPMDGNAWLAAELAKHPGLYGFGTVDFTRAQLKDQVWHITELGFKGIKLHPAAQQFDILSARAFEIYEAAEQAGLFLTFHTGIHWHRIKEYDVVLFDEIAYHFPRLRFSMEHVGGYHFFGEALAVIVNNLRSGGKSKRTVYAGLTSVFTLETNRFWHLGKDRLNELIAQAGADQLIFGLDFPYNLEKETQIALRTIKELELSAEDRAKVLGGNLRRVLNL